MQVPAKLCDACSRPGACCHALSFGIVYPLKEYELRVTEFFAQMEHDRPGEKWLQFKPIPGSEITTTISGTVLADFQFSCTALGPSGRCTIYDHRPLPCRNYEAGQDGLCVFHKNYVPPEMRVKSPLTK